MSLSINERKQRIAYLDVARGIGIFHPLLASNYGQLIFYPVVAVLRAGMMFVFFLAGMAFRQYYCNRIHRGLILIASAAIWVMLMPLCGKVDYHNLVTDRPFISLMLAFSGSIMVIEVSKVISRCYILCRIISWFGVSSLLLMVTHEYLLMRDISRRMQLSLSLPLTVRTEFIVLMIFE